MLNPVLAAKVTSTPFRQALSDATRALELEPRHFSALVVRGGALRELHDFEGAKAAYEALLHVHPWSSVATELHSIDQTLEARAGRFRPNRWRGASPGFTRFGARS